jgi:hypothetical protein
MVSLGFLYPSLILQIYFDEIMNVKRALFLFFIINTLGVGIREE